MFLHLGLHPFTPRKVVTSRFTCLLHKNSVLVPSRKNRCLVVFVAEPIDVLEKGGVHPVLVFAGHLKVLLMVAFVKGVHVPQDLLVAAVPDDLAIGPPTVHGTDTSASATSGVRCPFRTAGVTLGIRKVVLGQEAHEGRHSGELLGLAWSGQNQISFSVLVPMFQLPCAFSTKAWRELIPRFEVVGPRCPASWDPRGGDVEGPYGGVAFFRRSGHLFVVTARSDTPPLILFSLLGVFQVGRKLSLILEEFFCQGR